MLLRGIDQQAAHGAFGVGVHVLEYVRQLHADAAGVA